MKNTPPFSRWIWCLTFIVAFGVADSVSAQVIGHYTADALVDRSRLARIDTLIRGYIDKGWVNGVVTLVIHDEHVVQYKAYGYSDREAGKAMRPDDLFRMASQTKAVVSVGLMRLWEQGKFYLDEPIADILPAFRHSVVLDKFNEADSSYTTVPAKRPITFRDLSHSYIGYRLSPYRHAVDESHLCQSADLRRVLE